MVETTILAIVVAKLRGYNLSALVKAKALYPIYILEILVIGLQISVFAGYYKFIPWAPHIKTVYMLSLTVPLIVYQQWKNCVISSASVFFGTFLNKLVISFNAGRMPVYPTLSYVTGYVSSNAMEFDRGLHVLGDSSTKLKILTDYIDIGYSILSIGDIFIRVMCFLAIYGTIKHINTSKGSK